MNNEVEEDALIDIISLVTEYEIFLKKVYVLIGKYSSIESIEWIMKKDVNSL